MLYDLILGKVWADSASPRLWPPQKKPHNATKCAICLFYGPVQSVQTLLDGSYSGSIIRLLPYFRYLLFIDDFSFGIHHDYRPTQ